MSVPMIAILDDEPQIREILTEVLEEAGFRTRSFGLARDFKQALRTIQPDVCLIDLSLPDTDGLALVHKLALESGASIIIISGRAGVQDRVAGLELGADDYISKPFEPIEVVARVRARLRSPKSELSAKKMGVFGGFTADFDRYTLTAPNGTEQSFSHAEGEVLRKFLDNPKRLISRAQMQESFGGTAMEGFERAMDVRISRLRTKLGEDPKDPRLIKTIYGAGYIFMADVDWS